MDIPNPFGPLTPFEQLNDIANMFDEPYKAEYRPVIGSILKKYGYDIALWVFGQLRSSGYIPTNIWAYATGQAKQRSKESTEKNNKDKIIKTATKGNIAGMLDTLFLEGKISPEEYDSVKNIEDARSLIDNIVEREGNAGDTYNL